MEPAVRGARIEPAIIAARLSQTPKIPGSRTGSGRRKPCRGERNFWMQRREAKSGLRDRKGHWRPNERNDTGENPHRNGLSGVGVWICGFVGLAQTDDPPPSHRTGL